MERLKSVDLGRLMADSAEVGIGGDPNLPLGITSWSNHSGYKTL